MAAQIAGVFGDALRNAIDNSKILVVGAGGIGCEVLKNLVLTGFRDIEIIDLDTIDVSNLNRQFLFHKEHVGKSKAEVARKSALSFNPNVEIKAYHDSILSTDYGVSFFQRFKVVLNALDNRAARNHVNRMCLTARVPLIESGTAGYNGQVELIKKGETQCYECTPKAAQKSYPGCTIRNTPSEPIHCIVWAKHLFNQLFGEYNADEDVSPDTADPESTDNAGSDALNSNANTEGNIERVSTRMWAEQNKYDPEKLFNKLFHDDIKYLLSMENLWKTRAEPKPTKWGVFDVTDVGSSVRADIHMSRDQKLWTLSECADVFADSINKVKVEFSKLDEGENLVWDKDDKPAMDFVAACANIRSHIFGIPLKSCFEIKSMAGNIIPAIATTNAITAGLVVMRTFRVLQEQFDKCQSVYVRLVLNPRNQLIVPEKTLQPPNPKCIVCSAKPEIILKVDTELVTVKQMRDDILIKALNMVDPDVIDGRGTILISSEEGETDCNNDKKLKDLSIVDGCILKVDDFFQNYELTITIIHKTVGRDDATFFEVIADPSVLKEKGSEAEPIEKNGKTETTDDNKMQTDDDDDDLCIVDIEVPAEAESSNSAMGSSSSIKSHPKKRKTGEEDPQSSAKRTRVDTQDEDDDLICIDDD